MSNKTKKKKEIVILSTVSSGKSTLINSFIGKELMPSRNLACTSKLITVYINNKIRKSKAIVSNDVKYYKSICNCNLDSVTEFNKSDELTRMDIQTPMWALKDMGKLVCIVDTPGINNAFDFTHREITTNKLKRLDEGLIIYVINACNIGTDDDYKFLQGIVPLVNSNKNLRIIFIINKMDEINRDIEPPEKLISNVESYVKGIGISNPEIFPCSADAALIFRLVLNGEELSESQVDRFYKYFKLFRERGYSLGRIALTNNKNNNSNYVRLDDEFYYKEDIYDALKNTGISLIEKEIQYYIK